MPTGGPKDTIPPKVIKTVPDFNARNYHGNTIDLSFDEFVVTTDVQEQLVISPPLKEKPTIRSKGKTLIVDLGDSLRSNTTYSLDFKDAIVDNNEHNPLQAFRFAFSTGPDFDSLMIGGYVKNAENLDPVDGALVSLYSTKDISAFKDSIPSYVAKTDKEGFFVITNIAPGTYKLYALQDADNSMTYNQAGEQIAFYDTLIVPEEVNFPTYQSELNSSDTTSIKTKRRNALTDPFYLMMFEENVFNQYLDSYKRDESDKMHFYFTESLSDSFNIELLQPKYNKDWSYLEYSKTRDSLNIWITDTLIANTDSIKLSVNYLVADSLENLVWKKDTLEMFFERPEEPKKKRKKDDNEPKPIPTFSFKNNLKSKGFNVYQSIHLEAPRPLKSFDFDMIHLYQMEDTIEEPVHFDIVQDSLSVRKYEIKYPWKFDTEYRFLIDSAAAKNYFGNPSSELDKKFTIQEESYYGKIILSISNLKDNGIVQLLENSDKEKVLQQIRIPQDGEINFPYLNPDKYKIRLILDNNNNGKWDTGNLETGLEPEQVIYYPKILKIRSNFEIHESWALPDNLQYQKDLVDEDQQQKKRDEGKLKKRR